MSKCPLYVVIKYRSLLRFRLGFLIKKEKVIHISDVYVKYKFLLS